MVDESHAGLVRRRVLRGHTNAITHVAWSPDGSRIASSARDATVHVWDIAASTAHVLRHSSDHVQSVTWAPSGRILASCTHDSIYIWSRLTAERPPLMHSSDVNAMCMAWSPRGDVLAIAGAEHAVELWSTDTWKPTTIPAEARNVIFGLSWSQDGRTLAGASTDSSIYLWDINDGGPTVELTGHSGPVDNVVFSPGGRLLASASQDKTIRIWDVETKNLLFTLEGHTGIVSSVSFSADGQVLASKGHDGTIRLWRCDDWSTLAVVQEPTTYQSVFYASIAFHPIRSAVLATLGEGDEAVRIWDVNLEQLLQNEPGASGPLGGADIRWVHREEAFVRLRSIYETHLLRIRDYRGDRASPRCYVSFVPPQRQWVQQLTRDLREAGVIVVQESNQVQDHDSVVVVITPAYEQAWKGADQTLAPDMQLIRGRRGRRTQDRKNVVEILLQGPEVTPSSPGNSLQTVNDFRDESYYFVSLFDLVLRLYSIRLDHPAFEPLRRMLHEQSQEWLSEPRFPQSQDGRRQILSIFISYAHEDEAFKDSLVTVLAGLQRRGVIDAWQDRRIEEGSEWRASIVRAMNDCKVALLLVSSNFLASRFIQDHELPHLLQRRAEEGLRVVPIIVRPCLWQSDPVLGGLQAMPKDGRPIITFPESTGERDKIWTEVARLVESWASREILRP